MAQAGNFQFGVDESFLSQSVSRALINGTKMAQRSGALTPGINEQAFRQPLGRITGDVNKFQSSLAAANQRVIAFGASASVFYGLSTALKGLVTSTIQVNKSMVDINSIFGLSATNLGKFKNELFDVARKTSQSFGTVAESAKEFSRQGLSVEETLKRVRDSMILTRLTGLSAAEAANTLTAAMNSFNKSGLNTTEILNKMVAADSAFAVSSKDLADALTRVGSTAQDAGVQFEELLALVTSVKQITGREGAVIANGFKTIFNREERSTTIEMLERLGVAVRDQNSNILPTIQILKNLAVQYDKLGVSQKQQVAQMMGGVYQMNTLKAVMSDLSKQNSIYDQALKQIGKSQDEAIKRNEYLNTSFAAMVQRAQDTLSQVGNNLGEKIFSSNTDSLQSTIKNLFGKENFNGFLDGLKGVDTEGVGNTLGQGLIKGIGNVFGIGSGVPGPGLLAIGMGITKVIGTSLGMAVKDAQSMLGLNKRIQNIHVGIDRAILSANDSEKMRLSTAKSLAEQEMVILDILLRQNSAMGRMAAERNALQVHVVSNNPKLATQAIKMAKFTPNVANGYMPAVAKEAHSISRGVGGASPSAKPVLIPNFNFGGGKQGPIVANTDEYLVPNYAGRGSAIFNKEMVADYGVPAGAVRVAAGGFSPGLSPVNILNKFGSLNANQLNRRTLEIASIVTSQKGQGFSNNLYQELIEIAKERGIFEISGLLSPQGGIPRSKHPFDQIMADRPQFSRGKFGSRNKIATYDGEIDVRGGGMFYNDLKSKSSFVRDLITGDSPYFTTYLNGANGYIPNFANKFYRGVKASSIFNKFSGVAPSPFELSSQRGTLFASRDKDEAASYSDILGSLGEFSLGKGLKGLNLHSKKGLSQLSQIISSLPRQDRFVGYRDALNEDTNEFQTNTINLADLFNGKSPKHLSKADISDLYKVLDSTTVNNLLRKSGYDFISFPDVSNIYGDITKKNISLLNPNAAINRKTKNMRDSYSDSFIKDEIDALPNPLSIASGYIPNYARRGRPSIKGRQIRYEGDMDFREVLGPDALMKLFTIFGFDLGNHSTKSTIDQKALEKFGISIPQGLTPGSKFPYRGAANGLVPKSLSNAISREIKAGAPLSSIYLDKDSRLISKDNPQGLLVANRRDEPAGGFEGVNRYQNMGLNPKVAGSHIPNFADPSEMILKYLTKSGQATPILGDIAYPGSKASMGDAQASIEKYLSGIIKNINLKDVDFLSADFQKQIQTKIKGSIEKSFSGIDFGRTSAFSKITDQIIETREKEIKSLQNYQIAARENNVINQKRFAFEDSVRKSLRGGSATMMTPNEIIKQRTNQFTTEDIEYRGSRILTKQPLDLVLTEEEKFAANLKNQKSKLNKILEEQITHLKIREGTSFKSLTSSERKSLIGGLQDRAISTYNLGSSGLSKQEILQNQQARILITEQVKRDFAGIFKKDIPLPEQGAWSKFKGRMSSPIGQMAMMMGPSMLSGFIPEGQGGTGMGRSLGGAQGALQGMGTGAMFGPWGAAIGAIGGGLLGLASKWEKSFAELGKEIDEVNSKNMKVVNNVGLYVQQIDQISELMTEGTDPKKIKELIRKQTQLYGSFEDPEIRKALMSGKPEDAARMATEKAQRQQLKGDVLSSAFRGVEEISAPARFISSGLKSLQGDQTSILKRSLIGSINPALGFAMGANLDSSNQVGRVSEKNLKSFGQALLDASDDMDSTDLSRFSKLLSQDVSVALSDLANELGLTVEDLKTIREKLNPSEIKSGLSYFRELKGENLQRAAEAEPLLREKNRRFQISGIEWERAGFLGGIGIQQNNIRQSSNIRNQNAISSALLDVNPNISEISRVSRGGDIQLSNLRQNNTLSFQTAAMQAATVGVSDLARQSGSIFKDEDLRKLSGMYQRAAQTGSADELSSYLKELSDKQEAVVNSTDDAKKEQASNFKQLILASKDTVKELIGLNESSSASERELKISNALNVIRAKDQQKQSFLDKSVYSIDTFTQARRLKEQASGISFTDGKYKTGLTQQGKLNEADFLSNLGIANTDESLSYYNKVKSSRARSTLSELISQETGQKVGTDRKSVEAAINSIQDPIKAGRYRETLSLSSFNTTNAIKNIGAGTGSTSATIENLMKIGETDPIQTITAQNTGKIADIGVEMNGNIVEGFTNLWTLMDSAFNKNKESEIYTKAVGKRFGAEADVSRAKKERELRIQSALETPEVRKALGSYDFGNDTGAIKAFAKGGSYEDLRNALFSPDRLREHENKSGISGKMYEENTMNQLANIAKYEGSKDTIVNLSDADTQLAKFTDAAKIATEELTKLHNTNTSVTNPVLTAGIPSVTATKPTKLLPETDGDDNSGLEQRAKNIDKISNSFKGFKDGMKSATAEIMTFAQMGEEAGKTVANSLGNAFAGFVTGSIKGKDAWKSFVSSMLAGLAQMYAQEAMKSMMSSFMGANTGGSILKFASGGSVPALLTGGEYYFNASSAKAIGQNKLNSINSGTAHFTGGGLVSGGSGYIDDVPAMLDNGGFVVKRSAVQKYGASNLSALSRNSGGDVRMFASGGNVSPSFSTGSNISGGNTSVKIELNDHRTSASSSSDDSSSDPEFNRRLGMAIKSAVLQTVNEQKRIGGTLRE